MSRRRRAPRQSQSVPTHEAPAPAQEVTTMSELFTPVEREQYRELGGGSQAGRGQYSGLLVAFAQTGRRFATITTSEDGNMPGKKASSVATALKNAKKAENAPESVKSIKISSRGAKDGDGPGSSGVIFLENEAVEDEE